MFKVNRWSDGVRDTMIELDSFDECMRILVKLRVEFPDSFFDCVDGIVLLKTDDYVFTIIDESAPCPLRLDDLEPSLN